MTQTKEGIMNRILYKDNAIKIVVLILALISIISVFPLRIWQRIITEGSGAPIASETSFINDSHDVVQKFITQYDRLDSLDLYITKLERGRYLQVTLYHEDMTVAFTRYYDLGDQDIPGYVRIPVNLDVEVGETMTLIVYGVKSTFYAGVEDASQATSAYVLDYAYHDTTDATGKLAVNYNYEQPIGKKDSAVIILVIVVIAAVIIGAVSLFYKKKERDAVGLVTVRRIIQFTMNPIIVLLTLAGIVLVGPMQMFSHLTEDIVFYEMGVILSGLSLLYAVNHTPAPKEDNSIVNPRNLCMMAVIAVAIWYCCEYMNALYTIYQTLAERKEVICLLILIILTFEWEEVFRLYNLVYGVAAIIGGVIYRNSHLIPDTEKEYDLNNAAMTYAVIIAILAGFIILNLLSLAIKKIDKLMHKNHLDRSGKLSLNIFGIMIIAFMVLAIIFRNTRWWGVVLGLITGGIYIRYAVNPKIRKNYLQVVSCGLMLNFVVSMIYCLLFRFFAAFNMGRFPFVFHTVTITAEYLTFMECTAMIMLIGKMYRARNEKGIKNVFRYIWKEFMLFGAVSAYLIFTVSRTGYLACGVTLILIFFVTLSDTKEHRLAFALKKIGVMILSVIICFPAVFTLQRIVPSMVERPALYDIEESNNVQLNGGTNWDTTFLMTTRRFVLLFGEKILGANLGDYDNPDDRYNYYEDTGLPIYGENGVELSEHDSEVRRTDAYGLIMEGSLEMYDDYFELYTTAFEEEGMYEKAAERLAEKYKDLELDEGDTILKPMLSDDNSETEDTDVNEETESTEETEPVADETSDGAYIKVTVENEVMLSEGDEADTENLEEKSETSSADGLFNGRISIWKSYLSEMNLTGHDEMGATLPSGEVAVHAHNTYLQVMYDHGIPTGVIFTLLIVGILLAGGVYYNSKKDEQTGSLLPFAVAAGFAVAGLSEWVFQLSNPLTVALILSTVPLMFKFKAGKK
jgi:hypothetical protein